MKISAALPEAFAGCAARLRRVPEDRSAIVAEQDANQAYSSDTKSECVRRQHLYVAEIPAWAKAFNNGKLADAAGEA